MMREMDELKDEGKKKKLGWDGKKDWLTIHVEGPRVPFATKVSSPAAWVIWRIERPVGSHNHLQDDLEPTIDPGWDSMPILLDDTKGSSISMVQ